jgi:hypothetical protein
MIKAILKMKAMSDKIAMFQTVIAHVVVVAQILMGSGYKWPGPKINSLSPKNFDKTNSCTVMSKLRR